MLWRILGALLLRASVKVYVSPTPVGRRLGGHDIPQLADRYVIVDLRFAGHIVLLGYLQYS